jgi:hypothetical protein
VPSRTPTVLFALIVALVVAAGLVLVLGDRPRPEARSREFHQLVGGLGYGPAVDLSGCAFTFDPRLCPDCPHHTGPIPAGSFFCPHHAFSIYAYPPLRRTKNKNGDGR